MSQTEPTAGSPGGGDDGVQSAPQNSATIQEPSEIVFDPDGLDALTGGGGIVNEIQSEPAGIDYVKRSEDPDVNEQR